MTTNKHTPLPWVVELNPTIPEGIQVAAFETTGEMAGNRHLQIIIRSYNPDADAELIVEAVNNYVRLRDECDAFRAECDALRAKTSMSIGVGDGTGNLFVHGDYDSIKRVQALIFEREVLVKALELISDTDPDEGTAWFHDIAHKALAAYRKGGDA